MRSFEVTDRWTMRSCRSKARSFSISGSFSDVFSQKKTSLTERPTQERGKVFSKSMVDEISSSGQFGRSAPHQRFRFGRFLTGEDFSDAADPEMRQYIQRVDGVSSSGQFVHSAPHQCKLGVLPGPRPTADSGPDAIPGIKKSTGGVPSAVVRRAS